VLWLKCLKRYLYKNHQLFKDLLSTRNKIHWRRKDLDYFLSINGKIIFECFKLIQPEETDKLTDMIKSRNLRNVKKVIICVYANIDMTVDSFLKIVECVISSIPVNQDKTSILTGWIDDEKTGKTGIAVKLAAVCSEYKNSI
jgi:hypothetical protein